MLARLRVATASFGGRRRWTGSFRLGLGHSSDNFFGGGGIRLPRAQQELEQDRALELLQRLGDLLARTLRGVPFGHDPFGVRYTHTQGDLSDLSLPYELFCFHQKITSR